ncbi:hypothetical protein CPT_Muldoon_183 [Serratia phage Muldoon]|uniref:Uncharacterized protein n=1 Tax=Serratia phage Muldoon TaxID=2601678 RepID=A0A5P8PHJ2_9CAUD|nr:hypothetical protein HYP94_gp207 [Serratia phage Muldoon]QFR56134.1 hypothetical protein CPT_Muldoon_183 [Serratia phage Muldoon]
MDKLAVKVWTMKQKDLSFIEIAEALSITPAECGVLWVRAEEARKRFKNREKIVYRSRINVKKVERKAKPKSLVSLRDAALMKGWNVK